MRRLILALVFAAAVAAPALANDPVPWGGVGWYLIEVGQDGTNIPVAGVFSSQELCNADREKWVAEYQKSSEPAVRNMAFTCEYRTTSW